MELLIAILLILASLLIGYLLGSIPFGIIVGKLTKHVDIRTEGSKSSGGTNAGRVLGKKYGFLVFFWLFSSLVLLLFLFLNI